MTILEEIKARQAQIDILYNALCDLIGEQKVDDHDIDNAWHWFTQDKLSVCEILDRLPH